MVAIPRLAGHAAGAAGPSGAAEPPPPVSGGEVVQILGVIVALVADWVIGVVESAGYLGVVGLVALENVFPPLPSELVLPLAGFLASRGELWLPAVIVAATVGAVTGALILYSLGRWLGQSRLRSLIARYGRYAFLTEADLERVQGWFGHHGEKAVLFGRLIPNVRSLISIPAGISGMPLGRFVLFTAIGSGIWNTVLVTAGWYLGEQWQLVGEYSEYFSWLVLAVLAGLVILFVWRRVRQPA